MEKHLNKQLEVTTEKMMKGLEIDKPSEDFTSSLMQQIHALEATEATQYQPLISKPAWLVLTLILVATTSYIALNSNTSNIEWLQNFDLSSLTQNKLTYGLSAISLPKTFAYAIGLFGIMLCVQIPFLKHHFDKRFQV